MISVHGLTKHYGRTVAVRELTFEVDSVAAVKPIADQAEAVTDPLSAWAGFGMLCLYAAAALAAGWWALHRRDA